MSTTQLLPSPDYLGYILTQPFSCHFSLYTQHRIISEEATTMLGGSQPIILRDPQHVCTGPVRLVYSSRVLVWDGAHG